MSFLSVLLFYGCICILELKVIMVYLKVSFDLYVPRVFFHDETVFKCLLTFDCAVLFISKALTRESVVGRYSSLGFPVV